MSGLDGSNRRVLVEGDGIILPNSLVVDYYSQSLCWVDAGTHKIGKKFVNWKWFHMFILFFYELVPKYLLQSLFLLIWKRFIVIECIGVEGYQRRVILDDAKYPFGFTLFEDNFYYTDWNEWVSEFEIYANHSIIVSYALFNIVEICIYSLKANEYFVR